MTPLERALKKLPHRRWPKIRNTWIDHLPSEFPFFRPDTDIPGLLSQSSISPENDKAVETLAGLRELVFNLVILLRQKALYCTEVGITLNHIGCPTWGAKAMYEACYYHAKACCYMLGVANIGRDNKVFIDLFKVGKQRGVDVDEGHHFYNLTQRMTHEVLWSLFHRLLHTMTTDDTLHQAVVAKMRRNKFATLSGTRNTVLYDNLGWSRSDDILASDLLQKTVYQSNIDHLLDPEVTTAEFVHSYNHGAIVLRAFLDRLLADTAGQLPALRKHLDLSEPLAEVESYQITSTRH